MSCLGPHPGGVGGIACVEPEAEKELEADCVGVLFVDGSVMSSGQVLCATGWLHQQPRVTE